MWQTFFNHQKGSTIVEAKRVRAGQFLVINHHHHEPAPTQKATRPVGGVF
jgi:hypothetical protein